MRGEAGERLGGGLCVLRVASYSFTMIAGKSHLKTEGKTKHSFLIYSQTLRRLLLCQTQFLMLYNIDLLNPCTTLSGGC